MGKVEREKERENAAQRWTAIVEEQKMTTASRSAFRDVSSPTEINWTVDCR